MFINKSCHHNVWLFNTANETEVWHPKEHPCYVSLQTCTNDYGKEAITSDVKALALRPNVETLALASKALVVVALLTKRISCKMTIEEFLCKTRFLRVLTISFLSQLEKALCCELRFLLLSLGSLLCFHFVFPFHIHVFSKCPTIVVCLQLWNFRTVTLVKIE